MHLNINLIIDEINSEVDPKELNDFEAIIHKACADRRTKIANNFNLEERNKNAQWLVQVMNDYHLTNNNLAYALGVSYVTVSLWRTGKNHISPRIKKKIKEYLKLIDKLKEEKGKTNVK